MPLVLAVLLLVLLLPAGAAAEDSQTPNDPRVVETGGPPDHVEVRRAQRRRCHPVL